MSFSSTNIPDWGDYFLGIAAEVAKRASCYRAHVGCVIVKDNRILSTGYNGAPAGRKDCFDKKSCYRDTHNIESGTHLDLCYAGGAHAEQNALFNAARHGIAVEGAVLYLVGHSTICSFCQAAILNAGIYKVVLRKSDGKKEFFYPAEDFFFHPILDA